MNTPSTLSLSSHTQQGMALIVALVMLVSLTMIGVSASRMQSGEIKLAANLQNKAISFDAAESMLETLMQAEAGDSYFMDPIKIAKAGNKSYDLKINNKVKAEAVVVYRGLAANSCPQSGVNSGMRCHGFEIIAKGTHVPSGAQSKHVRGFYVVAP